MSRRLTTKLVAIASEIDVVIRLEIKAGRFVLAAGDHVAAHGPVSPDLDKPIAKAVVIGAERSPTQDVEFAIRQLVEIALRALFPGINNPFTAIAVIHRLGGAGREGAGHRIPIRVICLCSVAGTAILVKVIWFDGQGAGWLPRQIATGFRCYLVGFLGGRSGTRTRNPLIKSQLLYRLS